MTALPDSGLEGKLRGISALLSEALSRHGRLTYASSLGAESIVLTDLIATRFPQIDIFTIDTGRLHEETYALLAELQRRYRSQALSQLPDGQGRNARIRVVYPDALALESLVSCSGVNGFYQSLEAALALESLVSCSGVNGFYQSLEARLECCRIRKVEPFRRAILGYSAWITGVRRRHSADRAHGDPIEWDADHGLHKISPLLDWSDEDIWQYIRSRELPYNRLHDQGYPSIGCSPCTRAVRAGEDFRAGRWWWEGSASRECGLQRRGTHAALPAVAAAS